MQENTVFLYQKIYPKDRLISLVLNNDNIFLWFRNPQQISSSQITKF